MKILKRIGAGFLGAVMVGASLLVPAAIAENYTLADYPAPFVTDGSTDMLIVVGEKADPADVVGAINIAVRLGSEPGETKELGTTGTTTTVTGEGRAVATTNTKIYLGDSLGKSGLRTTMTKDDLPTLLKTGTFQDSDAGSTHKYQQYIYLTPSNKSSSNYKLEFEKPGSSSSADPTYNFGRFPTSPSTSNYFYSTYVSFDKPINGSSAAGETIELFGKTYTIHSDTSDSFAGTTSDKLVLAGSSATKTLSGGETAKVTIGGKDYEVTLVGDSDTTHAVVRVGNDQKTIQQGRSARVGGLDVYVDAVFYLSNQDQSQNSAKLLIGAEKIILQHGSKVKLGDSEDPVSGTYVELVTSSNKLSAFRIYVGGKSSSDDYISLGKDYEDPVWKSFKISFDSISPDLTDSSRSVLYIANSGDNVLQATITDDKGETATINWAYKSSSSSTTFSLADDSGDVYHVVEGETVGQDEYILLDSGGFTHLFEVSSVNLDGTTSASIELRDVFSGVTTKITTGADNNETYYIDGQAYHFVNKSSTTFAVTWGDSSGINDKGDYITVFPVLKGKNGEEYALTKPNAQVELSDGLKIELPTGALVVAEGADGIYNISATTTEDGETSTMTSALTNFNTSDVGKTEAFKLGRTSTGAVYYNITAAGKDKINITLGGSSAAAYSQPAILLVEEKDSASNVYSVAVQASTETSGSNKVAIAGAPDFTYTAANTGVTLGSNSNVYNYVDLYGVYAVRDTSSQDTVKIYYPDQQVTANVFVLAEGASTTTTGGTGTTYEQVIPVTDNIAKLATDAFNTKVINGEIKKNLILVGGPCANSLVAVLANENKTLSCSDWLDGTHTGEARIQLINDAFTTGKVALVVAGLNAENTQAACTVLQRANTYADGTKGDYQLTGNLMKVTGTAAPYEVTEVTE